VSRGGHGVSRPLKRRLSPSLSSSGGHSTWQRDIAPGRQTLHQSAVFLLLVVVLDIIEEFVIGLIHGQGTGQSIRSMIGRNPEEIIAEFIIVFLLFFPYFAFRSIGELLGEGVLLRLFFVKRQKLSVSSEHPSQR